MVGKGVPAKVLGQSRTEEERRRRRQENIKLAGEDAYDAGDVDLEIEARHDVSSRLPAAGQSLAGYSRCKLAVLILMVALLSGSLGAVIAIEATKGKLLIDADRPLCKSSTNVFQPGTSRPSQSEDIGPRPNVGHPVKTTVTTTTKRAGMTIGTTRHAPAHGTKKPHQNQATGKQTTRTEDQEMKNTQEYKEFANSTCPEIVVVSGVPSPQSHRNGVFWRQKNPLVEDGKMLHAGRPFFKSNTSGRGQFLFYYPYLQSWRIGIQPEAGMDGRGDGVISLDYERTRCPTSASGWHYFSYGWRPSPSIKVKAASRQELAALNLSQLQP